MEGIPKGESRKRGDADREAKLAQALRANLRRRKGAKDDRPKRGAATKDEQGA